MGQRRLRTQQSRSRLGRAIQEFDVADFLRRAGVDVEMESTQLAGECPFCHHVRTSFYIDPVTKYFKCHYCDEGGGLIRLIADVLDETHDDAIRRVLTQNTWADFEDEEVEEEQEPVVMALPEEFELLGEQTTMGNKRFWKYARSRGINARMARRYRIGFCRRGQYTGRLIVPVYWQGQLETFVARAVHDQVELKVTTPEGNRQSTTLFNLEQVWGQKTVIVVEGVFDALAIPDRAVATFGKKISRAQAELLAESGAKKVIFVWDSDAKGDQARHAFTLTSFFEVKTATLPAGVDPSSALPSVLRRAVNRATGPRLADQIGAKLHAK